MTAVELLVSIGIIGVLLAVGIPAVTMARESARKMQCKNNIRQLALACTLHDDTRNHYPVGRFYGPEDHQSGPDAPSWSWMAEALPFLEHSNIYEEGNIPHATHRESGVCQTSIPVFLCPTIGRQKNKPRDDRGGITGLMVGLTNYHGVSGANWGADRSQGVSHIGTRWRNIGTNGSFDGLENGDGMLYRSDYRKPRRGRHIQDGISNTLVIGEVHPTINYRVSWPYANNAYSTCAIPPNMKLSGQAGWENLSGFRSNHRGGLHFATVDGRVIFVDDQIELSIYRSLATIAGNESTSTSKL